MQQALEDACNKCHPGGPCSGFAAYQVSNEAPQFFNFHPSTLCDSKETKTADIFSVASISKMVVAVAIMSCVERGELDLDSNYAPRIPELHHQRLSEAPLTIRTLLTHRSGLQDEEDALHTGPWRVDGGQPCPVPLSSYVTDRASAFWRGVPGADSSYSNAGFTVLALVVERVTGTALRDLIQTRIFGPLGMKDSSFFLHEITDAANRYAVPRWGDGNNASGVYEVAEWPAAQLRSTARDLMALLSFLQQQLAGTWRGPTDILTQDGVRRMLDATLLCSTNGMGLGVWGEGFIYSHKFPIQNVWQHGGFMQGVRSHAVVWPGGSFCCAFNGHANYDRCLTQVSQLMECVLGGKSLPWRSRKGEYVNTDK